MGDPWEAYAAAHVDITFERGAVTWVPGGSQSLPPGVPSPLWVVTACNPGGQRRADEANEAANEALIAEVREAGWRYWPAVGRNAGGTWQEPSVAIAGATRSEVLALARRYAQGAVFEIGAPGLQVVAVG